MANRRDFMKTVPLAGTAQADGDLIVLAKVGGMMLDFNPLFATQPGTKRQTTEVAQSNPFEAVTGAPIAE